MANENHRQSQFTEAIDYLRVHPEGRRAFGILATLFLKIIVRGLLHRSTPVAHDFLKLSEAFHTDIRINGIEHLPKEGGFMPMISHIVSKEAFPWWLDESAHPYGYIQGLIQSLEQIGRERDLRFIALDDKHSPPVFHFMQELIHSCYGSFTVSSGAINGSLNNAVAALANDQIIFIAPEGKTTLVLNEFKLGVTKFAHLGKPYIPMAYYEVRENEKSYFVFNIGKAIYPLNSSSNWDKPDRRAFADILGFAVAELLPPNLRGHYSKSPTISPTLTVSHA